MNTLKIIKATYYDPDIGAEQGTDVTEQLSAEIVDGRLFYNGIYNKIFPDFFEGKHKKLKIEGEYKGERFIKFYDENEKINLPNDLGRLEEKRSQKFWKRPWFQIIILLSAIATIIGTIYTLLK